MTSTGDLRTSFILQEQIRTADEAGGFAMTWANVTATPVLYGFLESMAQHQHRITVRYRGDIAPGMRLLAGTKAYNIVTATDPAGREEWLIITAESVT